jgi:hypothetical protein
MDTITTSREIAKQVISDYVKLCRCTKPCLRRTLPISQQHSLIMPYLTKCAFARRPEGRSLFFNHQKS